MTWPLTADPDQTPTATPWQEYLAAAQALDQFRRDAAAAAAAATYATSSARAQLAQVTARLEEQRARLTGEAVRAGFPPPAVLPSAAERAAASRTVAGGPAAVPAALRQSEHLIDEADTDLTAGPPERPGSWPAPRWLMVAAPAAAIAVLLCAVVAALLIG